MSPALRRTSPKKPINHRPYVTLLALLLLSLQASTSTAQPAEAWGVEQVVEAALDQPELTQALEARLEGARAESAQRLLYPRPTFEIAHEQVLTQEAASVQLTASVTQQVDLQGWRDAARRALPLREDALRAEDTQRRLEVAQEVRTAFYAVLYHQARLETLTPWIERLERSAASTRARAERGDASRVERLRIERELALARAQQRHAHGLLAEAWARLERWVPWERRPALTGALTPTRPPEQPRADLPRLISLERQHLAIDAELEALGSPWLRGWALSAGYRFVQMEPTLGHGFVLSLEAPLAWGDTNAPRRDALRAEQRELEQEVSLARRHQQRALTALHARLRDALSALEELDAQEPPEDLAQLAEAAFAGGELSMTELLDAYASDAALHQLRIDLAWEARRSALELELYTATTP